MGREEWGDPETISGLGRTFAKDAQIEPPLALDLKVWRSVPGVYTSRQDVQVTPTGVRLRTFGFSGC